MDGCGLCVQDKNINAFNNSENKKSLTYCFFFLVSITYKPEKPCYKKIKKQSRVCN